MTTSLSRRPVAVVPAGHPARSRVAAAVQDRARVPVVDEPAGAIATIELGEGGALLLDAAGLALADAPVPLDGARGVDRVVEGVERLARASYLRDLPCGEGGDALPDDVEVSFARLVALRGGPGGPGGPGDPGGSPAEVPLARSGEHLHVGDRFVVRLANRSLDRRYVTVLDIGLRGAVGLMTRSEPTGVTLEPGEEYLVGETATGARSGIRLFWPDGLPPVGPRPETYLVLVTDRRVESIPALVQPGLRASGARAVAGPAGTLDQLLAGAVVGRALRDGAVDDRPPVPTRYRTHRLDLLLHPVPRGGEAVEPEFLAGSPADRSFRLVTPRPPTSAPAPDRLVVRLVDLAADTPSTSTSPTGRPGAGLGRRLETLVVTAGRGPDGRPFQARTVGLDPAEPLPPGALVLFDGPVSRFVDLAVWRSAVDRPAPELADLLAAELARPEVAAAAGVLARLADPDAPDDQVARADAAVAALVSAAADALGAATGGREGLYRTTFLPGDGFGTVPAPGRHPDTGLLTVGDVHLAFALTPGTADR